MRDFPCRLSADGAQTFLISSFLAERVEGPPTATRGILLTAGWRPGETLLLLRPKGFGKPVFLRTGPV